MMNVFRPQADYARARAKAEEVLRENFVTEPPVRLPEIADAYGIRVVSFPFEGELRRVAGFIDMNAPERVTIYVNEEDPPTRQNFTVAHELGHFFLHREKMKNHPEYGVLLRLPLGQADADPIEREANRFAAHLLVPDRFLERYIDLVGDDIPRLARLFGVSTDVIGYRLKDYRRDGRGKSRELACS